VKAHDGVHNLKSSWVQCANIYFPFSQSDLGRELMAGFLTKYVSSAIRSVDSIDLEYEDDDRNLRPNRLLGEEGGSKGANQTSPDLGILVNGKTGLVFVENKLVEHSFYPCSGHWYKGSRSKPKNEDPSRCNDPLAGLRETSRCHQEAWGRRYWPLLQSAADRTAIGNLTRCPARDAGYQLLRQQALAEGLANSGKYEFVISAVAMDGRNEALQHYLRPTGPADFREWHTLFGNGKTTFVTWEHNYWVNWVRENGGAAWNEWLGYVDDRYAYGSKARRLEQCLEE